jgi:ketosteroid isomerase-like protein
MSGRLVLASLLLACLGLAGCTESDPPSATPPAPSTSATSATSAASASGAAGVAVENAAARRFIEAVNGGSVDAVMATLADDAVVIDSGRTFDDAGAIRDWLEAEVTGVDGRMTVRSVQSSSAEAAELRVDFASSAFSGTDLRYRFTTSGDQVTNLTLG